MLTLFVCLGMMGVGLTFASVASAQDESAAVTEVADATDADAVDAAVVEMDQAANNKFAIENIMLFICAVLVVFMQAGFAMVEVGMNSAKNTVNILAKNVMDLGVGVILFFGVGYAIMYPGFTEEVTQGEYLSIDSSRIFAIAPGSQTDTFDPQVDFLFQVAFAATAATIVSGAVAGRMKFGAYLIYSALLTGLIYPVSGSWKWGYGWLHDMGFHDFAGSAVVHAVGGFAGLAGAIILGPRIGRFTTDGKSVPLPGHNVTFAALGVFILWIGWYGFNPGSVLAFGDYDSVVNTMLVAVNTTLAPAAGAVSCLAAAWLLFGKPDLTMALNGALGGLVGITANADCVTNISALIIGAIAGLLVLLGVLLLDKMKIDDPVGAWPVHGLCGIWGCLAAAVFGGKPWIAQIVGTSAICLWAFVTMFILFAILKAIGMLRVSPEEEQAGLDISEHGMHAYPSDAISGGSIA
ncbi:Ammonium transporter NrgA [Planctomycetes bacterium CA13]|uniref:Ammonium transporter n=2 Tax=Novipirellula herctigrandis TaxID=2527986 RepID=A0A5C5Z8D1_9BACT|nr:Ammonium transporter NrgA [Planctomycetes bacterium CA13]